MFRLPAKIDQPGKVFGRKALEYGIEARPGFNAVGEMAQHTNGPSLL